MTLVAFHMWEPTRQRLIAEHEFYRDQARQRLLSQFERMEEDAEKAADEYLASSAAHFDPETNDPSDFYESANDRAIEFHELLRNMRDRTRLGVIAGMYFEWDKKLRDWVIAELRHWHHGPRVKQAVWIVDLPLLLELPRVFGFDAKSLAAFARLDAMRLVVNVFKHGDGKSFEQLKEKYPEFLPDPLGREGDDRLRGLDHTHMQVSDAHLEQFSAAIIEFWRAVPERMCFKDEPVDVPKWFSDAYGKDSERTVGEP